MSRPATCGVLPLMSGCRDDPFGVTVDAIAWASGGALAGLVAGSFIATLLIRWPQDKSLAGRSQCDSCDHTLSVRDLLPLVSWLATAGKCRICGTPIDWRHPAIEAAAALIGVVALLTKPGLEGVAGALFGWQLLALAALDAEHYWLPDRLTVLLAVTGLVAAAVGLGVDLPSRVIGGAVGYGALFFVAYSYRRIRGRDGMGGGDPKLFGAIGCWIGWQALPLVLVTASVLGLIVALLASVRGKTIGAATRLPLGALMATTAFPLWILLSQR